MTGRRAGREEGLQRLLSTEELESLRPRLDGLIASLSPGLQSLPAEAPFEVVLAALALAGAGSVQCASPAPAPTRARPARAGACALTRAL